MDIADQAEAQEATQREMAIKHACNNTTPKLQHNGECYFCGNEIPEPKLFCDGGCAKLYDRRKGR